MRTHTKGFSLIELLIVIAILALLASFLGPAARNITMGNSTTNAATLVSGQMALARQAAVTRNNRVELRIYKFADTGRPGEEVANSESWKIRGLQAFEIKPDGTEVALSRMQKLPDTAIIDSNPTLSSLFDETANPSVRGTVKLPNIDTNYTYYTIRYKPNGGTELPFGTQKWFLTIHDLQRGDKLSALPDNFAMIQIDPIQGSSKLYRPGLSE